MDERRTHIDLFSGIGGFALAAKWNGLETVCFCEIDPECRTFLERTWPGIPVHEDVKIFPASDYRGAFLLTAGVPCQPVSCAGKRRGAEDDRWLWPEAIRIVSEAWPYWVIFENPPGIRTLGLDGILSEMETLGYAPVVLDIPACAVGSTQERRRIYLVANSDGNRYSRRKMRKNLFEEKKSSGNPIESFLFPDWPPGPFAQRGIPEMPDGVSEKLLPLVAALGNAIVPQVAAEIIRAIIISEEGLRNED